MQAFSRRNREKSEVAKSEFGILGVYLKEMQAVLLASVMQRKLPWDCSTSSLSLKEQNEST